MNQLVVTDFSMLEQFRAIVGEAEVRDGAGKLVGKFVSPSPATNVTYPLSDEERERRDHSPARPLSEIWKSLGQA